MTHWASDDVMANGIRIHYHRTGGELPPLVLAHGITDDGLCWTRLARELAGEYDVIMVDARGHGESEAPEDGYTWGTLAEDLAAFIRALGLRGVRLMGHSMGAQTAAAVAADRGDLVSRVVLEDPPWRDGVPTQRQVLDRAAEYRRGIEARRALSRDELISSCRTASPGWDLAEVLPWADAKLRVDPRVAGIVSSPIPPWRELARRIEAPCLLLTADCDLGAIVARETADEAERLLPRGRVVCIANAGHCIHRDRFDDALAVVREFLRGA